MTRPDHFPLIDQLRGLAAASVAWFHLTNGYHGWVAASGSWGWLGVEAFFVISGFVIPYSLASSQQPYTLRDSPHFFARRIIRIELPYMASIGAVIAVNFLSASTPIFSGVSPDYTIPQVLAHLFYLVPLTDLHWIQPVYWSLAYEFAFYIVIGLAFPFIGGRWGGWAAAVVVIALVATGTVSYLLALFVMGFAVHRRIAAGDDLWWTLILMVASGAAMVVNGATMEAGVGAATALVILFHRAIPAANGWLGAVLTGLGAISYSLYLVHVPIGGKVVNLGGRFIEGSFAEFALSLFALTVSIGMAVMFWRFVERPAKHAARRLRAPPRSIEPIAAVPPA